MKTWREYGIYGHNRQLMLNAFFLLLLFIIIIIIITLPIRLPVWLPGSAHSHTTHHIPIYFSIEIHYNRFLYLALFIGIPFGCVWARTRAERCHTRRIHVGKLVIHIRIIFILLHGQEKKKFMQTFSIPVVSRYRCNEWISFAKIQFQLELELNTKFFNSIVRKKQKQMTKR